MHTFMKLKAFDNAALLPNGCYIYENVIETSYLRILNSNQNSNTYLDFETMLCSLFYFIEELKYVLHT